jgi:DNA-binding IclR family transcriptional regulator
MSVRDTSKETYQDIAASGLIGQQAQSILDAMDRDVDYSLQEISAKTGIPINAVSGRCNELKKAYYLEETDKRKCSITKRTIHPLRRK